MRYPTSLLLAILLSGCASPHEVGPTGSSAEPLVTALSCEQRCEQTLTSPGEEPFYCSCEANCVAAGNCCDDAALHCPQVAGQAGCEGSCGGMSADGCFCDEICATYGDCCGDHQLYCEDQRLFAPVSDATSPVGLYVDPSGRAHLGLNDRNPGELGSRAELWRAEGTTMILSQLVEGDVAITDVKGAGPDVWTAIQARGPALSGGVTLPGSRERVILVRRDYEDTVRATAVSGAIHASVSSGLSNQIAVDTTGNVYLMSREGKTGRSFVASYSRAGTLRWTRYLTVHGNGDLAVNASRVFVAVHVDVEEYAAVTGYALDQATGGVIWSRPLAAVASSVSDIVADSDGFVLAADADTDVRLPDGTEVSCVPSGGLVSCSPDRYSSVIVGYNLSGDVQFAKPLVARAEGASAPGALHSPRLGLEPGTGRIVVVSATAGTYPNGRS